MSDLAKLAKPFPANYIEKAPQGKYGDYVAHHTINQALLAICGPFDLEVVQVLRGDYQQRLGDPALTNVVVGVIARLTVTVDGERIRVEEVGDCENPTNWKQDGARLKDALSDALKRCAMRLGLGLHLWAAEHYFLDKSLAKREENGSAS